MTSVACSISTFFYAIHLCAQLQVHASPVSDHESMIARSMFPLGSWNDGAFHCQRASSQGLGTVLFFRSEGASDDKI